MRTVLIALGLSLVLMSSVMAQELSIGDALKKIPGVNQGIAFSFEDSKLNYLSTLDIVEWKGVNLEAGVAADAENTEWKAVAVLSYNLLKVKDLINLPIINLIEFRPGIWVGCGRIEGFEDSRLQGEGDYGLSLSVVKVKF